jgi:YD repeat-containing protein
MSRRHILVCFLLQSMTVAHAANNMTYVYDAAGRLTGVFDAGGNTRSYTYDAANRLVAIDQSKTNNAVEILFVTSAFSASGSGTVKLYGIGFSATPAENQVTFNGVAAVVESSTTSMITVRVPPNAKSGPMTVTTPRGSAATKSDFHLRATSGGS